MRFNTPEYWNIPFPSPDDNKYTRGSCLLIAGERMIGASFLTSKSARRSGAGFFGIAVSKNAFHLYATRVQGEVLFPVEKAEDFLRLAEDNRFFIIISGPGLEASNETKRLVLQLLSTKKKILLDGGALTAFSKNPKELLEHLHENVILTPHNGEFDYLFPGLKSYTPEEKIMSISCKGCVVLKGHTTVIRDKDDVIIHPHLPSNLATAGTGDVLAGLIAGLWSQRMSRLEACAAGVWIHGKAAELCGTGLIAEDLPPALPLVLKTLI